MSGGKWYKPLCVGLTVVLLAVWLLEVRLAFTEYGWITTFGDDLAIYTDATQRLFSGGNWYLGRQLEPYVLMQRDVLYPPVTAWFFAPFVVLGPVVFLVAGVTLLAGLTLAWRPAPWTWPLIALCLLVPTSILKPWSGNPSLWVAVAVAAGLRWGWPGALVLMKPTFLPFALAGMRTRGWWLTVGALVVLSLPFLAETLRYPSVILNASGPLATITYSVWDWPLALIPVLAWLGRSAVDDEVSSPIQGRRRGPWVAGNVVPGDRAGGVVLDRLRPDDLLGP